MPKFRFIPDDWSLSENLYSWTRSQGLSETQIQQELEKIRDYEYRRPMSRPDACWRNWIRNAIKWGEVVPTVQREYRGLEQVSEEEKKADAAKAWAEMNKLRGVK